MSGQHAAVYSPEEAARAQIIALYLTDRPRFISTVISMAASRGYGRREAIEFANAVTATIRAELAAAAEQEDEVTP
ncbi:MAG TPA: hypothetical protein VGH54_21665 [Mycobacterium sp.]|uniref:hypothetical protein n=1 Tax=Mycobacterium sp. TaxID=1785 RepID=UPI002F3E4A98